MADNWWTDDTDDDDDTGGAPPNKRELPEPARQHMRKIERELKMLREENGNLKKTQHKNSVSDLIKAKGFDPEIAEFVPVDVEASDEAVTKWLETKGKFFAKLTGETSDGVADSSDVDPGAGVAIPPEVMQALGLVANVSTGGVTPTKQGDLMTQIKAANHEQLIEILRGQGATV